MPSPTLQFKRGILANLPGLKAGEPGFTTDSYDLYVGIDSTTSNNQFVGSGRYWQVNTATVGSGVKLVEGTDNGTNTVTIKSPNSLASSYTLTMPSDDGNANDVLVSDGSGNLSFSAPAASNFTLSADSGSNDSFSTGGTLTFTGGDGIETTVSDDTITITAADITTSQIAAATLVTESEGIGSNDNDTTLPTSAAVKDYTDTVTAANETHIDNLVTLSGVSKDTTNLGTFTGTTISDSRTVKQALQDLETSLETVSGGGANASTVATQTDSTDATHYLTFVDADNGSATQESIKTDAGITYNPHTNLLTVSNLSMAGVAVTAILDEDAMTSNRADALVTQQSIKAYVDSQVTAQDLDIAGDSGTGAVDLDSQSLTIAGTSNEIETVASNQTITIGLPNDVTVSNNLTVTGNLYVNGSTTQVNTATTTIEDQLLDLGMVDGSVPTSDLNKDIGVLFNYYSGSAKKAAVFWDDSTSRVVVSADVSESTGVLTNNTGGALEVASLYVSGCTGSTVEVIGCSGGEVVITNATIDGGSF